MALIFVNYERFYDFCKKFRIFLNARPLIIYLYVESFQVVCVSICTAADFKISGVCVGFNSGDQFWGISSGESVLGE